MTEPPLQFTFAIDDPNLEDDEKQRFAQNLLRDLRNSDTVLKADRAEGTDAEAGQKGFGKLLVGVLTAEVNVGNIQAFLAFLGDRFGDKPIKIKVKLGEKEVEIEAGRGRQLEEAKKVAEDLIATLGGGTGA